MPLRSTFALTPPTATFAVAGTNDSRTWTVSPIRARATPLLAPIGAPQRPRQHQEEIASGTLPTAVVSDAVGGAAGAESIGAG